MALPEADRLDWYQEQGPCARARVTRADPRHSAGWCAVLDLLGAFHTGELLHTGCLDCTGEALVTTLPAVAWSMGKGSPQPCVHRVCIRLDVT